MARVFKKLLKVEGLEYDDNVKEMEFFTDGFAYDFTKTGCKLKTQLSYLDTNLKPYFKWVVLNVKRGDVVVKNIMSPLNVMTMKDFLVKYGYFYGVLPEEYKEQKEKNKHRLIIKNKTVYRKF